MSDETILFIKTFEKQEEFETAGETCFIGLTTEADFTWLGAGMDVEAWKRSLEDGSNSLYNPPSSIPLRSGFLWESLRTQHIAVNSTIKLFLSILKLNRFFAMLGTTSTSNNLIVE